MSLLYINQISILDQRKYRLLSVTLIPTGLHSYAAGVSTRLRSFYAQELDLQAKLLSLSLIKHHAMKTYGATYW
jgi:hypothetical protein